MNKLIYLTMIAFLLLVPTIFAQVSPDTTTVVVKQNTIVDIRVPCFNGTGSYCDNTVKCNITASYPNSSTLIRNAHMTNQIYYNNYTLNKTLTKTPGIYSGSIMCTSASQGSGFSPLKLVINKDGIDLSGNMTSISVVSLILITLLIFFIVMAVILENNLKLVFTGLSFVMLPIILAIADSIIQDALLPQSMISMVGLGYTLSLYMLATFILYIMYKLTLGLKLQDNSKDGAKTSGNIQGDGSGFRGREKKMNDYDDNKGDFEDD